MIKLQTIIEKIRNASTKDLENFMKIKKKKIEETLCNFIGNI